MIRFGVVGLTILRWLAVASMAVLAYFLAD
jgi:hypothetical protein